jgi:putative regulator of septum formation/DnaJ-like protein
MPQVDHYTVLGVARDATEMEIRSAYGRAAVAQQAAGSEAVGASLKQAFDTLVDPERRRAYDATLEAPIGGAPASATLPTAPVVAPAPRDGGPVVAVLRFGLAIVKRFPIWTAVGLFALAGLLFRDYQSANVGDLKVGDCFDLPAARSAAATVKDVQHHPCTDTHDAEVVFVGPVPGANGEYPGDAGFEAFVKAQCVPAYQTYTGRDFETDTTYDMSFLVPLSEGWATGDHTLDCFAVRVDGQSFKGTIKAAR